MTTSRLQLALNVTDIDAATAFYRDLFGVEPAKQRPGYANFEIPDPPLKLVLFHNPDAASPLNHLGVEVATPAAGRRRGGPVRRRRAHAHDDRGRPLLPRRAGQGVGRRPRRAPRRLGVLHRPRRRPRPERGGPDRCVLHDDVDRHRAVLRRRLSRSRDMAADAVVVDDVAVTFGATHALDGVDLRVTPGTTLGVLGHNGAGKTTLIRVLTTLIRPDRGRVLIDGIDALAQPGEVRRRIGVTGQYAGLDDFLTTAENLELVGRLAGLRTAARGRARDLVDRFDLHGHRLPPGG